MTGETLTPAEGVEKLLAAGNPPEDQQNTPPEKQEAPEDLDNDQDDQPEQEAAEEGDDQDGAGDDPSDDDEGADPEPLYTVKIDGKEQQVTLKEALAGYQRGKDYAQKTGALAEERRLIEQVKQEANQKLAALSAQLSSLERVLSQEDPDLQKLKQTDPSRYLLIKSEREEALRRVQAEQRRVFGEHQAQQRAEMTRRLAEERERVLAAIPSWRDPKRFAEEGTAIKAYGKSIGFTDQELDGLTDHRAVVALRKAWLYDKGRDLKAKQNLKTKSSLPPGKSQSRQELNGGRDRDRAMERLKREGSVQAGVAALLARKN